MVFVMSNCLLNLILSMYCMTIIKIDTVSCYSLFLLLIMKQSCSEIGHLCDDV